MRHILKFGAPPPWNSVFWRGGIMIDMYIYKTIHHGTDKPVRFLKWRIGPECMAVK